MPTPKKTSSRIHRLPANKTDIELAQQIAELRGITVAGFDAVNDHLKTLNGRVGKHDDLFASMLEKEKYQDGTRNGISVSWRVFLAIATIVLGILAIIFVPR